MKIQQIAELLNTKIICGAQHSEKEVDTAFASDLMSDVLTLKNDNIVLITGLANTQTIRTAEMANISMIILARNKKFSPEMIELAEENDLILMECEYSVFRTSGLLYQAGIKPVF
jgi:serine kinase of HPr protein (carbohydrate metabolism regulator)